MTGACLQTNIEAENNVYGVQGNKNQEYQGSDGATEGGDPEWQCSYDKGAENMAAGFGLQRYGK